MRGDKKRLRGRPFERGNPGRRPGSKNKIPRGMRASIRDLLQELFLEERDVWKETLRKSMRQVGPKGFPFFQMALHVLDGRPVKQIQMREPQKIIFQMSKRCEHCKRLLEPDSPAGPQEEPVGEAHPESDEPEEIPM